MIKIEHLQKIYNQGKKNEEHVLKDISLTFGKTGLVCLLGESGSGKTTLLNTIGGLDTFSGGTINIDGILLEGYNPSVMEPIRNDRFDYIFQNYYLLGNHTVAYNVKLALNRFELSDEEKEKRVEYVLSMLGMEKYKKKQVSKLSGGQQQRVSIARALVKSPDIILADEPTGNLDEENTIRTMSILKAISKECLVILVTHERRIARFFADRIIEIRDGEVVRDIENHAPENYERMDDANIYLKEMECSSLESDFAKFRIYTEETSDEIFEDTKISLSIALRDGKLYIKNHMHCDVILEGAESGVQMLEEHRPKLDMEELKKFSYDLPKLKSKGKASLPGKEILRMALENIKAMGKKQAYILAILVVTAVLLTVTLADFFNSVLVDEETIVHTDSHYIMLDFAKVSSLRDADSQQQILDFAWEHLDNNEYGKAFAVSDTNIYLTGEGYAQMTNLLQYLKNYCYVSKEYLKEETLLYGKMPEKRNEIVIDIRIINQLIKSEGVVSSLYKNVEDYLGAKLTVATTSEEIEIVGICDTGESDIFCSQNLLLGFPTRGFRIADVKELQAAVPEEYKDLALAEDEILLREGLYKAYEINGAEYSQTIGDDAEHVYRVVGSFPDSVGADYIMSEEGCKNVRDIVIYELKECMFYTENAEAAMAYFESIKAAYSKAFHLEMEVPHELEAAQYKEAHQVDLDAKYLMAAICAIISLVLVYFTVKANAVSRSEELTVYRLIGISKQSILKAYILEMFFLTCVTSLPAVFITSGVIKIIAKIPSLEMGLLFPWWSVIALLAVLYLVHIIISILPVYGILSKPPAALALKE